MKTRKNIPIARVKRTVPYSPTYQPDVAQFEKLRGDFPNYSPLADNFVVTSYDALPSRATQYYAEFFDYSNNVTIDGEGDPIPVFVEITFDPVEKGRTLIIRGVGVALGIDTDDPGVSNVFLDSALIGLNGFPVGGGVESPNNPDNEIGDDAPQLTLMINGVAQSGYGQRFINDALIDTHHFPTYMILSEDETFSIRISWALLSTFGGGVTRFLATGGVYGDLLYTKGTDPILEPVNTRSIPVEMARPEIVDTREIGGQRRG